MVVLAYIPAQELLVQAAQAVAVMAQIREQQPVLVQLTQVEVAVAVEAPHQLLVLEEQAALAS